MLCNLVVAGVVCLGRHAYGKQLLPNTSVFFCSLVDRSTLVDLSDFKLLNLQNFISAFEFSEGRFFMRRNFGRRFEMNAKTRSQRKHRKYFRCTNFSANLFLWLSMEIPFDILISVNNIVI